MSVKQSWPASILAIDPATVTGWAAYLPGRQVKYGTWDFRKEKGHGRRWTAFYNKLVIVTEAYGTQVIAYERPSGRHGNALIHHAKMAGVIELVCGKFGMGCAIFSAAEIKKFATGKGNSPKKVVIKAAIDKLGYTGKDHNEADALWILELAKSRYHA